MNYRVLMATGLCFSSLLTAAKDSATVELDKLIVTATRRESRLKHTPGISFVVNDRQIGLTKAARASEILGYVPGLDIEAGTGVGLPFKKNVSINGLPSFHNLVLVDGKRLLSSHFHTGANIDMVPSENIERIEIVKDASSALYGSDALGGVINIITRKGTANPRLGFHAGGGSLATGRCGLSFRGKAADAVLSSSFVSWEQSKGMHIVEGSRKDNLDYKQLTIMENVDIVPAENARIGVSLHYAQHNDLPYKDANYDSWLLTPGLDFSLQPAKNIGIHGIAYYSQWNADLSEEKNEIATPQLWFAFSGLPRNVITFGGEFIWRNFERTGVTEHDQRFVAAFLQDELDLFDKFKVLGALRVDYVDNTASYTPDIGPRFSPKLSALYRPIDMLGIRAGVGSGFRAPHVQDLYESRYHPGGGGIWRYGNPDLTPETSFNVNGGIDADLPLGFGIIVNGFFNNLQEMIAIVRATKDSAGVATPKDTLYNGKKTPVWQRENINEYRISGFDVILSYQFKSIIRTELGGSGNWQNSDDPKAKDALLYPGHKIFGKVTADHAFSPAFSLNGFLGAKHAFSRRAPGTTGALDDYTTVEAGLGVRLFSRYELYFKGTNLLAQEIQLYEDALWTIVGEPLFEGGIKADVF